MKTTNEHFFHSFVPADVHLILYTLFGIWFTFFTYSLTAGVLGAPQMTSQPVSLISSLFTTALWDLANCRPVLSLLLSSRLFFCLHCLLSPFIVPCKMVLARSDERETCPYHFNCASLRWSGLRVVRLLAGSWHGLPR